MDKESNIFKALQCISTGIYGYSNKEAVHVTLQAVKDFLSKYPEVRYNRLYNTYARLISIQF